MLQIKSKNKIIFLIFLLLLGISISSYLIIENKKPLVVGFVTDIHAGDQDKRSIASEPGNIVFPKNFEKNLKDALENMKDADIIIALGDNLNRPSRKNAKKLIELTDKYPFYWVKGNHDKLNHFEEILSPERYYYIDNKKWRIIVLDNSEAFPLDMGNNSQEDFLGFIDEDQLAWLKNSLKTKRNVIIAMHVPMVEFSNINIITPEQEYLENIFLESGNVKHIFAGHFHTIEESVELRGITHHLMTPLSLINKEGHYRKIEFK